MTIPAAPNTQTGPPAGNDACKVPRPPATARWLAGEAPQGPTPEVSVLMPVHNGAAHLQEALQSVLAQEGCCFELVVVDDASDDGTTEMLEAAAAEDHRLRVLRFDANVDICHGLNAGMAVARARWIARIDADDAMLPGRLVRQLAFAQQSGAIAMGTYVDCIDDAGRRLRTLEVPLEHDAIDAGLLSGVCTLQHTAMFFDRAIALALGGYDPAFASAEDLHLWLRMAEVGTLANQPEVLQRYRLSTGSMSGQRREEQLRNTTRAAIEACARRGLEPGPMPQTHWRPAHTPRAVYESTLRMGWWASQSGEKRTAAAYARACLLRRPLDHRAWFLLKAALLR